MNFPSQCLLLRLSHSNCPTISTSLSAQPRREPGPKQMPVRNTINTLQGHGAHSTAREGGIMQRVGIQYIWETAAHAARRVHQQLEKKTAPGSEPCLPCLWRQNNNIRSSFKALETPGHWGFSAVLFCFVLFFCNQDKFQLNAVRIGFPFSSAWKKNTTSSDSRP